MKTLNEYIIEKVENNIDSEEEFREYAENKFKEVFKADLDEEQMNETIDGIIETCDNDWGVAIGMLNKSFGS